MALINCAECNHQVSDQAPACPKCGVPISTMNETKAAGTQINTVQETSKKFKAQTIASVLLVISGFMLFNSDQSAEPSLIGPSMMMVGIIWYLTNKVRIWWHHK